MADQISLGRLGWGSPDPAMRRSGARSCRRHQDALRRPAVIGGSPHVLVVDSGIATAFVVLAIVGFRYSLWLIVAALATHGILDVVHGEVIANPGGPGVVAGVLSNL